MNKLLLLFAMIFAFVACSSGSSSDIEDVSYNYDTSLDYNEELLVLDSISNCIRNAEMLDKIYTSDSIFIKQEKNGKKITFPSQIHSSIDNIKSIGVYEKGDTLKVELIEKEKTHQKQLLCPVFVYATIKGDIKEKYILTFTGLYPLVK
ncbi:hypothetical protein [Fibrobacter sp. HC4]|uniref:hypothetical protein n=1 Tax=Fibrobacter sp. HC4 TaxID=3239812 RepID=UPI000DC41E5F|nr:hypothetical protein [Fibrobacter succinogenes]MCL4102219.1 hypothetical protein [Fibrobacter succinogenes]MCQ2098917.1 hypothetical protein [Fibrobacter sp.]